MDAHNKKRKLHNAPPLQWAENDDKMTPKDWAEKLAKSGKIEHDSKRTWGENIAQIMLKGQGSVDPCAVAVDMW